MFSDYWIISVKSTVSFALKVKLIYYYRSSVVLIQSYNCITVKQPWWVSRNYSITGVEKVKVARPENKRAIRWDVKLYSESLTQCPCTSLQVPTRIGADVLGRRLPGNLCYCRQATSAVRPVSYTHLTLPTNREV